MAKRTDVEACGRTADGSLLLVHWDRERRSAEIVQMSPSTGEKRIDLIYQIIRGDHSYWFCLKEPYLSHDTAAQLIASVVGRVTAADPKSTVRQARFTS